MTPPEEQRMPVVPAARTHWEPFAEFADFRNRVDRAFDDLLVGPQRAWTPAIDVERLEGCLVVRADVPGFKPDDVRVEIQDDVLTVRGEHEERPEDQQRDFVRRERRSGAFARSMALPAGVDADAVTARTRDGVLEVTIPLPQEGRAVTITPTAE